MAANRRSVASSGTSSKGTQGSSIGRSKSSSRTASTNGSNTPLSSAVKTVFAPENRCVQVLSSTPRESSECTSPKQMTPTSNNNNETAQSLSSTPTTSNILSPAPGTPSSFTGTCASESTIVRRSFIPRPIFGNA